MENTKKDVLLEMCRVRGIEVPTNETRKDIVVRLIRWVCLNIPTFTRYQYIST